MKKYFALVAIAVLMLSGLGTAQAAPVKNLKDCDGVYSGTYRNVTVQEGSSCTLTADAVVIGGVHAKKGAENLYVHTGVGHNIMAMGVTGTVMVGPEGCKYDPPVGNNLMVKKSHNVLICLTQVDNNIMVTGNDGKITVRDSSAGNNIMVNRNLKYVSDGPVAHRHPGWIRLFNLTAGNHITYRDNDRVVKTRNLIANVGH